MSVVTVGTGPPGKSPPFLAQSLPFQAKTLLKALAANWAPADLNPHFNGGLAL